MLIFFGIFLQLIGFLLCFTIIGAVLGIPLILIGGVMILFGFFGRKTTITNVITVSHTGEAPQVQSAKPTSGAPVATLSSASAIRDFGTATLPTQQGQTSEDPT